LAPADRLEHSEAAPELLDLHFQAAWASGRPRRPAACWRRSCGSAGRSNASAGHIAPSPAPRA